MPRKGENIRKRTDGRWEGRYPAWSEEKGRNVSKSVYAKTYAEVREKLAAAKTLQRQKSAEQSQDTDSSRIRYAGLDRVASEWLDSVKRHRKYGTYIKYEQVYRMHLSRIFSEMDTTGVSMEKMERVLSKYENPFVEPDQKHLFRGQSDSETRT